MGALQAFSFLDTSYYDDVKREKEHYGNPSVCLVAEDNGTIVGIIDVEYEENEGDVCYFSGGLGAVIWHLAVLPEFRRKGVAKKLWETVKTSLQEKSINRFEVWTQDDVGSCGWYENQGFIFKEAYLNAYISGQASEDVINKYLNLNGLGEIYGFRNFNFEAPINRKDELSEVCCRLYEVRVYELVC